MRRAGSLAALAGLAVLLPAGSLALAMWPQSPVYGEIRSHGDRGRKLVALTFDDGPNAPATMEIAGALEAKGVRGTFFLVGANVVRDPSTVRALVAGGHIVGHHSFRHQKRDAIFDFGYDEAADARIAIRDATGLCTALYRPPNGFHTPWQLAAVQDNGMTAVAWDVQTYDWENPPAADIAESVVEQVEPGSIVLLHDGEDLADGVDRAETVAALPLIIDRLRADGYEFTTVDQLMGIPAYRGGC
jgi:peptidoglycan/xylan/chitin deacetylase (PgdA/CDA1 family)